MQHSYQLTSKDEDLIVANGNATVVEARTGTWLVSSKPPAPSHHRHLPDDKVNTSVNARVVGLNTHPSPYTCEKSTSAPPKMKMVPSAFRVADAPRRGMGTVPGTVIVCHVAVDDVVSSV